MLLHEIYQGLGEARFRDLLGQVSMGRLKTYQLYEPLKVRLHLNKLNAETLKKITPRLWERITGGDEEMATELAQAVLVTKLDVVMDVLDYLGVPHNEGFFDKDAKLMEHLPEGWEQKAYDAFHTKYSPALVLFYINHLAKEATDGAAALFLPATEAAAKAS